MKLKSKGVALVIRYLKGESVFVYEIIKYQYNND
jgi:hypothetical protein